MLALMIIGFLLVIALEVPSMVAKGQKGELRAFWALLALGFYLSLSVVQRWPVPNPTPFLAAIFLPMTEALGMK